MLKEVVSLCNRLIGMKGVKSAIKVALDAAKEAEK